MVAAPAEGAKISNEIFKDDLPYIACDVCKLIADYTHSIAQMQHVQSKEGDMADFLGSICVPSQFNGRWLQEVHIEEKQVSGGIQLTVVKPGGMSYCNNDCRTVARSCDRLLNEELVLEDISAFLWKGRKSIDGESVEAKMCGQRCDPQEQKLYPYVRREHGETFTSMTDAGVDMAKLSEMGQSGMGDGMPILGRENPAEIEEEEDYLDEIDEDSEDILDDPLEHNPYDEHESWDEHESFGKAA